jgi:hypothetical protein
VTDAERLNDIAERRVRGIADTVFEGGGMMYVLLHVLFFIVSLWIFSWLFWKRLLTSFRLAHIWFLAYGVGIALIVTYFAVPSVYRWAYYLAGGVMAMMTPVAREEGRVPKLGSAESLAVYALIAW